MAWLARLGVRVPTLPTDPDRFGGDPADAFTVVAPSLPGFTLSFKPGQARFGVEDMADAFATLMTDVLGYPRFAAQGGDWGSFVSSRLGYRYPERVIGIHLNLLAVRREPQMLQDPTADARCGGASPIATRPARRPRTWWHRRRPAEVG